MHKQIIHGLVLLVLAAILYCVSSELVFAILVAVLAIAGVVQMVSVRGFLWWFKE